MGNSPGKEQRPSNSRFTSSDPRNSFSPSGSGPTSPTQASFVDQGFHSNIDTAAEGRLGRPDIISSLGAAGDEERPIRGTEWRKETKQEREARKLEKERVVRAKERERSMSEEHVDGGYLVTQGVYTGTEDFNKGIVRQLMIERRIAPFWRGLNDHQESWTEHQLVAAVRGRPIPAADEIPQDEEAALDSPPSLPSSTAPTSSLDSSTLPITAPLQSQDSESPNSSAPLYPSLPSSSNPPSSLGSALAKGRSKTLATLTSSSKTQPPEMRPREIMLPKDLNVNGQRLEAYLYKDASECPICFLYCPPYLNKTRCCDQGMCSECFVQIKRPNPHPPEHADPTMPPPPPASSQSQDVDFVSEPATCPFCKVPQFGITYEPPPFRRGLVYANHSTGHIMNHSTSGMSSSSSLASAEGSNRSASPSTLSRRRTTSVSATSPSVITTDQIRPDWAEKLAAARAVATRRSAAATALHTAAYLMGNRGHEDARGFAGFGRRSILRRTSGSDNPSSAPSSSQLFTMMSERQAHRSTHGEGSSSTGPRSQSGSGHGRWEDLEDMMMLEAIRLSLASEEERRKKEEKESKKEARKKGKEAKKTEKEERKAAKRMHSYPTSRNNSTSVLQDLNQTPAKGKGLQLGSEDDAGVSDSRFSSPSADPQSHLERARAQIYADGSSQSSGFYNPVPFRPSHLRTQSNVSSSASSIEGGSAPGSPLHDPREPGSSLDVSPAGSRVNISGAGPTQEPFISGTPPGGGAGSEPMFNFRSLAAMVGDDDEHEREAKRAVNDDDDHELPAQPDPGTTTSADARNGDALQPHLGGDGEQTRKGPRQHETVVGATEDGISSSRRSQDH